MDSRTKPIATELNLRLLRQTVWMLQRSSEKEKPKLMKQYCTQFHELLADLRIKMAAPKSGPTKTLITKIKHHGS